MGDAVGELLFVMRNHNQCLVLSLAEEVYYLSHSLSVVQVQTVKRFIQYEQFRVFDKGSSQEAKALFSARELEESLVLQMLYAKDSHPLSADISLLWSGTAIETYAIRQTACHDVYGWQVAEVCSVHLGRDIADVFLNLPDAFSCATSVSKEFYIASIALRIVGAYER